METGSARNPRKIFVAYPYSLYATGEYRALYQALAKEHLVTFEFADERITSRHILEKIQSLISSSGFGIYDISGWNPNVTLELGLALGLREDLIIAMDPTKASHPDAPSDVRGIDRIEYRSLDELREKLAKVLKERLPARRVFKSQNVLWNPSGQPTPTEKAHAAAFREVLVEITPNLDYSDAMVVSLSFVLSSTDWKSVDYDHAPWVHLDFLNASGELIEIADSRNFKVIEFEFDETRPVQVAKTLRSSRWSEVAGVKVWFGGGYAICRVSKRNWSPYMIFARTRAQVTRLRRRIRTRRN